MRDDCMVLGDPFITFVRKILLNAKELYIYSIIAAIDDIMLEFIHGWDRRGVRCTR